MSTRLGVIFALAGAVAVAGCGSITTATAPPKPTTTTVAPTTTTSLPTHTISLQVTLEGDGNYSVLNKAGGVANGAWVTGMRCEDTTGDLQVTVTDEHHTVIGAAVLSNLTMGTFNEGCEVAVKIPDVGPATMYGMSINGAPPSYVSAKQMASWDYGLSTTYGP